MYCEECGEHVIVDLFGYLIHDYQEFDDHYPVVGEDVEEWYD